MKDKAWKVHARHDWTYDGYDVLIKLGDSIVQPVLMELKPMEPNVFLDPSLRMEYELAQKLLQALWDAGLRPNNGESSLAHVEALKCHLKDMQELVWRLLNPPIHIDDESVISLSGPLMPGEIRKSK